MSGQSSSKIEVIIGRNVKAAREALGWKQSELAERTGSVSRPTIAKIEGGCPMTVSTLSSVADALGIPPYMLMLRTTDWKKLANIATCQSKIERYQSSGDGVISPEQVERIQEMSASNLKKERRYAVSETNAIVAKIFCLQQPENNALVLEREKSRIAGAGIATSMIPCYPIINGLIANLIST